MRFINRNTNLMILVYNYFYSPSINEQSIALAILVIVLKYPNSSLFHFALICLPSKLWLLRTISDFSPLIHFLTSIPDCIRFIVLNDKRGRSGNGL